MNFKTLPCTSLAVLGLAAQIAGAHHDVNAFDLHRTEEVTGTVKLFRWSNPHSWLYVDVPNANADREEWLLEGGSVAVLARNGWTSTSIRTGDKVRVVVAPRKDGKMGGEFVSVTLLETGQVLRWGIM